MQQRKAERRAARASAFIQARARRYLSRRAYEAVRLSARVVQAVWRGRRAARQLLACLRLAEETMAQIVAAEAAAMAAEAATRARHAAVHIQEFRR